MSDHEEVGSHNEEAADSLAIPRFKRIVPKAFLRWFIPVWIVCLITGSLLPGNVKVRLGTTSHEEQVHLNENVIPAHRITHIGLFAFTACLLLLLARTHEEELKDVCVVIALGGAIEFTQHLIYHFPLEWWDVRDDSIGAIAAYLVFRLLQTARPMTGRSRVASPPYRK